MKRLIAITALVLVVAGPCHARHLPHDRDRDGRVTCEEWDRPSKDDLPCGFKDGEPV